MANIEAQLNTIRKAENGESVRDAIADAIDAVNRDGAVTLTNFETTHNGRWKAGDGLAYKRIVVNVEGGGSSNISMESFKVDVDTAPGEYKASEVIGENKAWDTIIIDTNNDLADSMGELVANEEKDYYPEDYGLSGFNKVTVQVTPTGEGPFTVNFWSDKNHTTLLGTQIVNKGGQAIYTGAAIPSTVEGYFIGWNPDPHYVIRNMDCVPMYGSKDYGYGKIDDEWSIILANKGEPYKIGSWKSLNISTYYSRWPVNLIMVKVAEGEQGSKSTWLSKAVSMPSGIGWPNKHSRGSFWSHSPLRTFLNGEFFNNALSSEWKASVKPVDKISMGYRPDQSTFTAKHPTEITRDYFWIPGAKEMYMTTKVPGYIKNCSSSGSWYFHQSLRYNNQVFNDDYQLADWSGVDVEDDWYYNFIKYNDHSLCYMRDFFGNNIDNTLFFDNGGTIMLRDGEYNYGEEYGLGMNSQTINTIVNDYAYTIVSSPTGHNPRTEGWYETYVDIGGQIQYIPTTDSSPTSSKTYYTRSSETSQQTVSHSFINYLWWSRYPDSLQNPVCLGFCLG